MKLSPEEQRRLAELRERAEPADEFLLRLLDRAMAAAVPGVPGEFAEARRKYEGWPEWERRFFSDFFGEPPDPWWSCPLRHLCEEAQTCNGKECLFNG